MVPQLDWNQANTDCMTSHADEPKFRTCSQVSRTPPNS